MKKITFLFVCFFMLIGLSSCKNDVGYVPSEYLTMEQAESSLGEVNSIYNSVSSRFINGQQITNGFGFEHVEFYAVLVEYNSISKKILDYVEGLESNNALMHQNYENFTFDADKKYVELASYTDLYSHRIIAFEVRVFFGNFMDTYATEGWYAKSVTFSPDLVVDIYNHKNIWTGTEAYYWGQYRIMNAENSSKIKCYQTSEYPAVINKFGTVETVYSYFNEDGSINSLCYDDGSLSYVSYMAVLTSLDDKVKEYFDSIECSGLFQRGCNAIKHYDSSKYYIEYVEYTSLNVEYSNSYGIRYLSDVNKMNNYTGSMYAKCFRVWKDEDIYDSIVKKFEKSECNCKVISEYPKVINKFGTVENVYTYFDENGNIEYQNINNGASTQTSYMVVLTELNENITAYFETLECTGRFQRGCDAIKTYDSNKFYIEYVESTALSENNFDTISMNYLSDANELNNYTGKKYAKNLYVCRDEIDEGKDIYNYIVSKLNKGCKQTSEYPEVINKFGTVETVYTYFDENGNIEYQGLNEGVSARTSYMVVLTELDENITAYFETLECTGCFQRGCDAIKTYDSNKFYIEYVESTALSENNFDTISMNYLSDANELNNYTGKKYAKNLYVSKDEINEVKDIYNYIVSKLNKGCKQTSEYPEVINKFGTVETVYTYFDENGNIEYQNINNGASAQTSYMVVLTELDENITAYFETLECTGCFQRGCDAIKTYDSNKFYIEYVESTALSENNFDTISMNYLSDANELNNYTGKGYAKNLYVCRDEIDEGKDIYNYIVSKLESVN